MTTREMHASQLSHLDALQVRLSHERARLTAAKKPREIELRTVWVAGIEREIMHEMDRIGGKAPNVYMSDDELLAALGV